MTCVRDIPWGDVDLQYAEPQPMIFLFAETVPGRNRGAICVSGSIPYDGVFIGASGVIWIDTWEQDRLLASFGLAVKTRGGNSILLEQ